MKTYVQFVDAQQFTGDVQALKDFAGEANVIETKDELLVVENTVTGKGKWRVVQGDFVVKTRTGFEVYKEAAFNEYFEEVMIEDEPAVVTEVENKELVAEVEKAKEDLATEAPEPAAKNTRKAKDVEAKK